MGYEKLAGPVLVIGRVIRLVNRHMTHCAVCENKDVALLGMTALCTGPARGQGDCREHIGGNIGRRFAEITVISADEINAVARAEAFAEV